MVEDRIRSALAEGQVVRLVSDVIRVPPDFHGESGFEEVLGKQVEHQETRAVDDGGRRGVLDVLNLEGGAPLLNGADREVGVDQGGVVICLLYTSPSPRDRTRYRMPSSA